MDLQPSLPPLPLPDLSDTIRRFLDSVRPILTPLQMWQSEQAADVFTDPVRGRGPALQQQIAKMAADSLSASAGSSSWHGIGDRNWLAPLWLDVAYLRGRAPLPVNVSFYSTDQVRIPRKTSCQAARAAGILLGALEFGDRVHSRSLPPFLVGQGPAKAPVDMSAYDWLAGGCRVPGRGRDSIQVHVPGMHPSQAAESVGLRLGDAHVIVLRGTAIFKVPIQRGGRRATFSELRGAMEAVIRAVPSAPGPGPRLTVQEHGGAAVSDAGQWSFPDSPPIQLLTTWDRDSWAEARELLLAADHRHNDSDASSGAAAGEEGLSAECSASVLDCESALFAVTLFFETHDEAGGRVLGTATPAASAGSCKSPPVAPEEPASFDARISDAANRIARTAFTGDGTSWWADKTVSFGVFADARSCWHIEHTPADAPVPSHLIEHAVVRETAIAHAHLAGEPASAGLHASGSFDGKVLHSYPRLDPASPLGASSPFAPHRLRFPGARSCAALSEALEGAADDFAALCRTTGLFVGTFERWGSSAIKQRFRCAPDAFFQGVLQMAGARFFGRAVLTYESGSTRAFAHGRTETIRGATMEAQAACEAMARFCEVLPASSQDEHAVDAAGADDEVAEVAASLLEALSASCTAHKAVTGRAMRGQGVDRHMLALRVLDQLRVDSASEPTELSALWRSPAWMLEYELSTSQTPLVQEFRAALPDTSCLSLGGGFGPSCPGGVGVSYFLLDKFLYYHCSSSRTADAEAECGAPGARIGDVVAAQGSPMAHARAFARCVTAVLLDLERACRVARPQLWRAQRTAKL